MYTPEFDNYFHYNTEEVKLDVIKAAIKERETTSPYVFSRTGKTVYHKDYAEYHTHLK